jgi:hypothetical protein
MASDPCGKGEKEQPATLASGQSRLKKVNESLRDLVATLEADRKRLTQGAERRAEALPAGDELKALREEATRHRAAMASLTARLKELEAENRRVSEEIAQAERQHVELAQFMAALSAVHASLDRPLILQAIQEILANLIGSEDGAVLLREAGGPRLSVVHGFGPSAGSLEAVQLGRGPIGSAVARGELYLPGSGVEASLSACVPLLDEGEPLGAIAVFKLLPQKPMLTSKDRGLLQLLGEHASLALRASARCAPTP